MIEILRYEFFQNALLGCLLACALCSMVGTYVVTRRLVFMGGGVAHASLGGVGLGALMGFSPLWGAAGFSLLSGFGIQWLSRRGQVREDSAIAMLWTFGMSFGILCAYMAPGFMTDMPSYLFGNILSVTTADIIALTLLTLLTAALFALRLRAIVTIAYDAEFARTQNLPVRTLESIMTSLIALTIVSCLHIAGIILVVAFLSIPQMTASLFARSFKSMMWLSFLLGLLGYIVGLMVAYAFDVPSGAAIIICSIAIYFICKAIKITFFVKRKRHCKLSN